MVYPSLCCQNPKYIHFPLSTWLVTAGSLGHTAVLRADVLGKVIGRLCAKERSHPPQTHVVLDQDVRCSGEEGPLGDLVSLLGEPLQKGRQQECLRRCSFHRHIYHPEPVPGVNHSQSSSSKLQSSFVVIELCPR